MAKAKKPATDEAPAPAKLLQRPPAEVQHADELARLRERGSGPRPPGWQLSPRSVRTFVLGDAALGIRKKFVGSPSLVDRAMVTLATNRGLLLVGEPRRDDAGAAAADAWVDAAVRHAVTRELL